ncbi:MAG: hypothetical protein ACRDRK_00195 [Pseudonocardia sp.]
MPTAAVAGVAWFGLDATGARDTAVMSRSVHATLYRLFDRELSELLDTVLAGEVVADRDTAEHLIRTIGALLHLHAQHPVDAHGRCSSCRPPRIRWPWRRSPCSVHAALSFYLRHPPDLVLTAVTESEHEEASR